MNQRDVIFLLAGIIIGLIAAYCLAYGFVIGFTESSHGIIESVNTTIQINESKLIEAAYNYQST